MRDGIHFSSTLLQRARHWFPFGLYNRVARTFLLQHGKHLITVHWVTVLAIQMIPTSASYCWFHHVDYVLHLLLWNCQHSYWLATWSIEICLSNPLALEKGTTFDADAEMHYFNPLNSQCRQWCTIDPQEIGKNLTKISTQFRDTRNCCLFGESQ